MQVAEYMEEMQEDSEENYNKHFSKFIEAEVEGGDLEDLYKEVRTMSLSKHACCASARLVSAFATLCYSVQLGLQSFRRFS